MATLGTITAGPQWSDIALASGRGSTLAISLAEEADSTAVWECRVTARTAHGSFFVGKFLTVSPVRGDVASRLVAICYYPGALSWVTSWRLRSGGAADSAAETTLSAEECTGTTPGITPITPGMGPLGARTFGYTPLITAVPVAIAPAGALMMNVNGQMISAEVIGTTFYVLLFDQLLAPVVGDIPIWSKHMSRPAAATAVTDTSQYDYNGGQLGRPIVFGLWAAACPGANVYAVGAVGTFTATTELVLP
jgi:hypothetical protein